MPKPKVKFGPHFKIEERPIDSDSNRDIDRERERSDIAPYLNKTKHRALVVSLYAF